jgi:hypothetical protein
MIALSETSILLPFCNNEISVRNTVLLNTLEEQVWQEMNLLQQSHDQYTEAATQYYLKLAEWRQVMGE